MQTITHLQFVLHSDLQQNPVPTVEHLLRFTCPITEEKGQNGSQITFPPPEVNYIFDRRKLDFEAEYEICKISCGKSVKGSLKKIHSKIYCDKLECAIDSEIFCFLPAHLNSEFRCNRIIQPTWNWQLILCKSYIIHSAPSSRLRTVAFVVRKWITRDWLIENVGIHRTGRQDSWE